MSVEIENRKTEEQIRVTDNIEELEVSHMGVITPKELYKLKVEKGIGKIRVMEPECDWALKERFEYTPEQYEILYDKMREIVGDIPEELTHIQKVMIIYRRLSLAICYDHELVREEEQDEYYAPAEKVHNPRNLINGLIKGKCVCSGYADILYNCLQMLGIECCKIYRKWTYVE